VARHQRPGDRRRLVVTRVSAESPAQRAGIVRGSVVTAVAGEKVGDLAAFYRKLWAQGPAGVEIPLTVEQNGASREISIKTMNRYDYLKLDTTLLAARGPVFASKMRPPMPIAALTAHQSTMNSLAPIAVSDRCGSAFSAT